jgi:cation diffusion facilitator CzcD-associated flavoprotein CzcO
MAAVERVLIVGAGIGGLAMAIALREQGIAVEYPAGLRSRAP